MTLLTLLINCKCCYRQKRLILRAVPDTDQENDFNAPFIQQPILKSLVLTDADKRKMTTELNSITINGS